MRNCWNLASDDDFIHQIKRIFEESMLGEIQNVISDVRKINGDLQHRGHVIAVALVCALDAVASYGYRGHYVSQFIRAHFPAEYHEYADRIYELSRNELVHDWNLFQVSIYADESPIRGVGDTVAFGLLNFHSALVQATEGFLESLASDGILQRNTLEKYDQRRKRMY